MDEETLRKIIREESAQGLDNEDVAFIKKWRASTLETQKMFKRGAVGFFFLCIFGLGSLILKMVWESFKIKIGH